MYRWGVAIAQGKACDQTWEVLGRLAVNKRVSKKLLSEVDLAAQLRSMTERFDRGSVDSIDCAAAVTWAAAMPELIDHLDYKQWWDLLGELRQYRETVMQRDGSDSLSHLIVGGELGLTLAWRLSDLPSCSRLRSSASEAVKTVVQARGRFDLQRDQLARQMLAWHWLHSFVAD